jgi:DNA-binding XRE family transcriptional regulator
VDTLRVDGESVLIRIAQVVRQSRINAGSTQAEQADKAEISLRAAQNIENGVPGQTAVLFKYLQSLSLLDNIFHAYPDPSILSPLEALAVKDQIHKKRPKRVSKVRKQSVQTQVPPKWGDE